MIPLLPAYIWSGDQVEWRQLIESQPGVAVINPASGPGDTPDTRLLGYCQELLAASWRIVGYVATTYAAKPIQACYAELARYIQHGYPITGAFWDEAAVMAPIMYQRGLHGAARALVSKSGLSKGLSFFNPGGGGTLPAVASRLPGSVWVTFEGPAAQYTPGQSSARQAHLVYDDPTGSGQARMEASRVGYGYSTPDSLPNPWDTFKG